MSSLLSQLSGNQDEATQAGQSIGAKTRMINEYKDSLSKKPSAPAQKPAPPVKDTGKRYGDKPGEKRIDVSSYQKPLGSYKKGGKVRKTGIYKLHAKERVLNSKQTAKMEKKGGLAAVLGGK